ncbi:hypothetical protein JCM11491_002458 [Sporobolomyces phaffii]
MQLLLAAVSFAGLAAAALPSPSESLVWTRVDTSRPSSTSPIVWTRVDTSKPSLVPSSTSFSSSSSSPLVWSRVDTSKPSPTSSSSSPLVWSRVNTATTTTTSTTPTSTLVWTSVITTRSPSPISPSPSTSPSLSSTTTTSPSSTRSTSAPACPKVTSIPIRDNPSCVDGTLVTWFKAPSFLIYQLPLAGFYNTSVATNGTGYYSGVACDNVADVQANQVILRVHVSEDLAALHGGLENLCGKKLAFRDTQFGFSSYAIVTRSCSREVCPGVSWGLGAGMGSRDADETFYHPPRLAKWSYVPWLSVGVFHGLPKKLRSVVFNEAAWFDWDENRGKFF